MKRKIRVLALCLLLAFGLSLSPAQAAETVYFVATGEYVIPLTDATMPFWSNGYLYISGSIFTGTTRDALDISYVQNATQDLLVLYGDGKALIFDPPKNYAQDALGNTYYPGAVQRGGSIFVPAAVVASFFGLVYTTVKVDQGYLTWLRHPNFGLTAEEFASAAAFPMMLRYEEYLKTKEQSQNPETPDTSEETTPIEAGKRIYLCLEAGENTASILSELERQKMQGAFFCSVDFLRQQGDLLRRMSASGQSIGILIPGEVSQEELMAQLEAGNQALYQATCGKTRLVYCPDATESMTESALERGYCLLQPQLDRSGYNLNGSSTAASLFQRVTARRGDVSVWLGQSASASGMRSFLRSAGEAQYRCAALTETTCGG